jgi:hypothetical protein
LYGTATKIIWKQKLNGDTKEFVLSLKYATTKKEKRQRHDLKLGLEFLTATHYGYLSHK